MVASFIAAVAPTTEIFTVPPGPGGAPYTGFVRYHFAQPSGLAEGDLLVMVLYWWNSADKSAAWPSAFSRLLGYAIGDMRGQAQARFASAGDVSAWPDYFVEINAGGSYVENAADTVRSQAVLYVFRGASADALWATPNEGATGRYSALALTNHMNGWAGRPRGGHPVWYLLAASDAEPTVLGGLTVDSHLVTGQYAESSGIGHVLLAHETNPADGPPPAHDVLTGPAGDALVSIGLCFEVADPVLTVNASTSGMTVFLTAYLGQRGTTSFYDSGQDPRIRVNFGDGTVIDGIVAGDYNGDTGLWHYSAINHTYSAYGTYTITVDGTGSASYMLDADRTHIPIPPQTVTVDFPAPPPPPSLPAVSGTIANPAGTISGAGIDPGITIVASPGDLHLDSLYVAIYDMATNTVIQTTQPTQPSDTNTTITFVSPWLFPVGSYMAYGVAFDSSGQYATWYEFFTVNDVPVGFATGAASTDTTARGGYKHRPNATLTDASQVAFHVGGAIAVQAVGAPPAIDEWPTVPAPPPGLTLADAIPLSGAAGSRTFDNNGASDRPPMIWAGDHAVWFVWTAPQDGTVSFTTSQTPPPRWDSLIVGYHGPTPDDGSYIGYGDDEDLQPGVVTPDGYGTSLLSFPVTAGQQFVIAVDTYDYNADSDGNPSSGYPRNDCVLAWSMA